MHSRIFYLRYISYFCCLILVNLIKQNQVFINSTKFAKYHLPRKKESGRTSFYTNGSRKMTSSKRILVTLQKKAGKQRNRSLWLSLWLLSFSLKLKNLSCWNLIRLSVASQSCYSNFSGLPVT